MVGVDLALCVVNHYPIPNTLEMNISTYTLYRLMCGYNFLAALRGIPLLNVNVTDTPSELQGTFECLNISFARGVIWTEMDSSHSILTIILLFGITYYEVEENLLFYLY